MPLKSFCRTSDFLTRDINHGVGNGYVCLPKDHKYYGVPYYEIDCDVHGGLTFGGKSEEFQWLEIPKECRIDHYIIGFDTAHYRDTEKRWSREAVEAETEKLLKQMEKA